MNRSLRVKLHSCIPSSKSISIFKGFLARTAKICSEKYLRVEIEYLANVLYEMDVIEKQCKRYQ